MEVKSIESVTGISLSTRSSDVPLDASLQVSDVSKNYNNFIKAYDINLYSYYKNGYIKTVKDGVKIMIPVDSDFSSTGKAIYYINVNGEKEEKLDYSIENIDGTKYITFITNHFSVYAIAEDSKINNPSTGISNKYGFLGIAILLMLGLYICIKKYSKFSK